MRRASLPAVALLFLLSGCGGGGGQQLTKEEYASKADAICGKYNQQVNALAKPTSVSALADVADKTLPILDSALNELKKLTPPADEQATAARWLEQVRNLRADLKSIRDKAKSGDLGGIQAVVPKAQDDNSKSNALATDLGMSVCNKD